MPYVKKGAQTEVGRKIEELSGRLPYKEWYLPDPYDLTSYVTPIGGLTKIGAGKEVIGKFFEDFPTRVKYGGVHPYQALRQDLTQLLRVIAATPKKAIEHIKEFQLTPGGFAAGSYHPEVLRVFESGMTSSPMATSWAHEAGHGASIPMLGKILKRKGYTASSNPTERLIEVITDLTDYPEHIKRGLSGYHSYQPEMEGIAEYLGGAIQSKAGYIPHYEFGHGAEQGKVFEELSKMTSKNPYMNVYRYLQKVVK